MAPPPQRIDRSSLVQVLLPLITSTDILGARVVSCMWHNLSLVFCGICRLLVGLLAVPLSTPFLKKVFLVVVLIWFCDLFLSSRQSSHNVFGLSFPPGEFPWWCVHALCFGYFLHLGLAPCVHGCFVLAHIDHCVLSLENRLRRGCSEGAAGCPEPGRLWSKRPFCCSHVLTTEDSVGIVVGKSFLQHCGFNPFVTT